MKPLALVGLAVALAFGLMGALDAWDHGTAKELRWFTFGMVVPALYWMVVLCRPKR